MFDHGILNIVESNKGRIELLGKSWLRQNLQTHEAEELDEGSVICRFSDRSVKNKIKVIKRCLVLKGSFKLTGRVPDVGFLSPGSPNGSQPGGMNLESHSKFQQVHE